VITTTAMLETYRRWHWLQRDTQDIDPVYPVLRELTQGWDREERAWLVLLHVGYYHLGSTLRAFDAYPIPHPGLVTKVGRLPCATERRGHRNPISLARHWLSLLDEIDRWGSAYGLLCAPSWAELVERLAAVHGNGRWATYKAAEMAQKVLDVPIVVPDAAHADSSGPRKGLSLVLGPQAVDNGVDTIRQLDTLTTELAHDLREIDLGYVETSLCDFHSLAAGRYYLGHDIDQMLGQLYEVPTILTSPALLARRHSLPDAYLGEIHGWRGINPDRRKVFARSGYIMERFA
jgi:hypothetical protein